MLFKKAVPDALTDRLNLGVGKKTLELERSMYIPSQASDIQLTCDTGTLSLQRRLCSTTCF